MVAAEIVNKGQRPLWWRKARIFVSTGPTTLPFWLWVLPLVIATVLTTIPGFGHTFHSIWSIASLVGTLFYGIGFYALFTKSVDSVRAKYFRDCGQLIRELSSSIPGEQKRECRVYARLADGFTFVTISLLSILTLFLFDVALLQSDAFYAGASAFQFKRFNVASIILGISNIDPLVSSVESASPSKAAT